MIKIQQPPKQHSTNPHNPKPQRAAPIHDHIYHPRPIIPAIPQPFQKIERDTTTHSRTRIRRHPCTALYTPPSHPLPRVSRDLGLG